MWGFGLQDGKVWAGFGADCYRQCANRALARYKTVPHTTVTKFLMFRFNNRFKFMILFLRCDSRSIIAFVYLSVKKEAIKKTLKELTEALERVRE